MYADVDVDASLVYLPRRLFELNHRVPLDLALFFHTFLPPVILYYATNILALLGPKVFVYRLALLPVTLFTAYRTVVSLDIAGSFLATDVDKLAYMNEAMALAMFIVCTRSLARTFGSTPQRLRRVSQTTDRTKTQVALDAADLSFNLRGCGWNFSESMKQPPYTRPLSPKSAFLTRAWQSLILHIIMFDFLHYASQQFGPDTIGSTTGGSIYDMSVIDPSIRYLRSTVLNVLVGMAIYGGVQIGHDAFAIIGVTIFLQSPTEWPPIFRSPWLSTSLTDFWAARWHQLFRQDFIAIGGKPLSLVAGRAGGVLGAFFVSGILHYIGLWGMHGVSDLRVLLFFLVMGLGVILEGLWSQCSGMRVRGWFGWIWTAVWLVTVGPLMTDPWCQNGIMGSVFLPQAIRPSTIFHAAMKGVLDFIG
ncbi:membrane bound O-acyl transferase family-domain-containing protein [Mycena belliarum]|uniref:Membrane bound O-acyl transferase family-domain-containing protein n=1 Tax=Mycena belliarum TaxID=1033014 RepID=A0AAD6UNA8_9AGAR|nr:membrane bound O-acyl transferase family-domain-containing protein [Mycena belliae]